MRPAFPSMSPTTLLICARASLIGFRLSVENSSSSLRAGCSPPLEVHDDRTEEEHEARPADPRRVRLLADDAHDRGDGEDGYQPQPLGVRRHPQSMSIVIERRFRGPNDSGNGGYSAGRFALAHGGDVVEVTLRLPPPLETPLELDGGRIVAGDAVVADVRAVELGVSAPDPVAFGDAVAAATPDLDSPFPQCFVCGHARGEDGLHIHAGPVAGLDVYAAPWTPRADAVGPEFVWAALDCP